MSIKAIETYYNGYRFRSRLEARWAVFFDAAGIKYIYEPEGFEHEGVMYLPDFYLPDLDAYAEVKGHRDSVGAEIEKCKKMVYWGGPIKQLIFLGEVPGDFKKGIWHFPAIAFDARHGIRKGWWFFFDSYKQDVTDGHISDAEYKDWDDNDLSPKGPVDLSPSHKRFWEDAGMDPNEVDRCQNERTIKAYVKARQARFEHGERPEA